MKSIIATNDTITSNSKQLDVLKSHFPSCFDKHGAFMPAKLQEIVEASGVALSKEGYSLNWLGKSYARLLANENVRTLLKANTDYNNLSENANSQNMLIKGDNLEVLKHLMGAYSGKVKMIYIDPPYNTGSDGFIYQDDRKFTVEQLSHLAGIDEDEAKRILEFTDSGSNSHSAWLTFMYPRLKLAEKLLCDEGVIFISIDDNEQAQLKLLCDEVFGEDNFVATIPVVMNLKGNQDNFGFADTHELLCVYSKSKVSCKLNSFKVDEEALMLDWQEDEYGLYKEADNLRATGVNAPRNKRPNLWYPIFIDPQTLEIYLTDNNVPLSPSHETIFPINPEGEELSWYWGKPTFNESKHNLIVKHTKNGWQLYKKQRPQIGDIPTKKPKSLFYKPDYSTSTATNQLKLLMGQKIFQSPKPLPFIRDLVTIGSHDCDIVLDFFAGSGTTAHAVMQLNAEDGGNRQFISVQIDEPTYIIDEKTGVKKGKKGSEEAFKAGYETIYDITAERIKCAAAKIKEANPEAQGDFGFKQFETIPVFEGYLDEPDDLTPELELFNANKLSAEERHILMLTWQVQDGIALNTSLTSLDLDGYTAYQGGRLVYFIEPDLTLSAIVAFLERLDNDAAFMPNQLVVLGYLLDSKTQREMTEAVKQYNNRKGIELTLDVRF